MYPTTSFNQRRALDRMRRNSLVTSPALILLLAGTSCVLAAVEDDAGDGDDASSSTGPDAPGTSGTDGGRQTGGGETNGEPPPTADDCEDLQTASIEVLERYCSGCHNPEANTAGFGFVTDVDALIVSGRVVPGDSDSSPIIARIDNGTMPPPTAPQFPVNGDVEVLRTWIDDCLADAPEVCTDNEWITMPQMVQLMISDLATISVPDRPFVRYFTLTHLHNIGYCDSDMNVFRHGLSKMVNSLSTDPIISPPVAIDPDETIYRIDLRDYNWEAAQGEDKWDLLVSQNPYAIELDDDESEVLKLFTENDVPFQAADWLMFAASQAPLYYDMLNFADTLQGLEADLGIDIDADIANREVIRAGFLVSGVSQSNRVVERHQLPDAGDHALWISYDFASNDGAQNIFANPLDFEPNGGEVIFNLPNGMQAYMIVDAAGLRLDAAPVDIVTDPLQDDKTVHNGISCVSCHSEGIKFVEDELSDFVASSFDFDAATKDLVDELYPDDSVFAQFVASDANAFVNADALAWPGDVAPGAEPVLYAFSNFDQNVDLERAAAELGITTTELLSQLGKLDPQLAALANGAVARGTFEATFAEAVCALNIGLADDPACEPSDPSSGSDDSSQSCEGRCGDQATSGCFCDDACLLQGDCCADFEATCN